MIRGLIMAAVFVCIGMHLEPSLNTTVAMITTPTYSSGVAGLNGVIMTVFHISGVLVLWLILKSRINAG